MRIACIYIIIFSFLSVNDFSTRNLAPIEKPQDSIFVARGV